MVSNKTELIAVTSQWVETAKADIAKHTAAFMDRTGATVEVLANILDTDVETITGMLEGTADIPMSLFAKILVGTGHVIMITPESQMAPMNSRHARTSSRLTSGHPMPMPSRDARGRFVPRGGQPMMPPYVGMPMPYGGYPITNPNGQMPSPEEVFGNAAPRGFEMPNMETPQGNEPQPEPMVNENGFDEATLNELAQTLRANPEVANVLRRLIG